MAIHGTELKGIVVAKRKQTFYSDSLKLVPGALVSICFGDNPKETTIPVMNDEDVPHIEVGMPVRVSLQFGSSQQ